MKYLWHSGASLNGGCGTYRVRLSAAPRVPGDVRTRDVRSRSLPTSRPVDRRPVPLNPEGFP